MHHKAYSVSVIAVLFLAMSSMVTADNEETVYGWEIMTKQERIEHREKMRSLKTEQEREEYRIEHHEKMQKRAEEMGVKLPDEPLPRRRDGDDGMRGMGGGPNRM